MATKESSKQNTAAAKPKEKREKVVISTNRKAHHDYSLEDSFEAGLVLMGSEIKSIRDHKVNLADGFVQETDGELWLLNVHISPYNQANRYNHEPLRPRKLLLNKKEIARLITRVRERGYSIIPTQLYLKNGRAKVEIALARGKKQYDKRDDIQERESKRQIERVLKQGRYED
ncbi:MAG: SsrA-binding protein SmpB [Anaerolineae bacterium]|nr:SsrA-binding protein SmpB [Anaerolineae bacterium]